MMVAQYLKKRGIVRSDAEHRYFRDALQALARLPALAVEFSLAQNIQLNGNSRQAYEPHRIEQEQHPFTSPQTSGKQELQGAAGSQPLATPRFGRLRRGNNRLLVQPGSMDNMTVTRAGCQ